jgi:hypothetical protein
MIEAGSETTSMQLNNMLIGILSNPEILERAHEELDRVIGTDRPPMFTDEPRLPYIRAIVKVSPLPHNANQIRKSCAGAPSINSAKTISQQR